MRLFEEFKIKFDRPDWSRDAELGLMDTILEQHPHLISLLEDDLTIGQKQSVFGRKDTPVLNRLSVQRFTKSSSGLNTGN